MSEHYIRTHFDDVKRYASVIETRLDDSDCTMQVVLDDNAEILRLAKQYGVNYVLIDGAYEIDIENV